ncbi:MAG: DUF5320 domain-containing protein [Bacilli bacterium]
MPRGDQTGPYGMGPMTGWGMGRCQWNYYYPFRRGYRPFYSRLSYFQPPNTKENLEFRKKMLEEELNFINEQLSKLS